MHHFPKKLSSLLDKRKTENNFRELSLPGKNLIDFSSNDYLGFSINAALKEQKDFYIEKYEVIQQGSTGSRLITGNHLIHLDCETQIAAFHQAEKALLFNSGYDANVGVLSSVLQRGDIVLCDELCHASIIDGIRLSFATAYKFKHNDLFNLQELMHKNKSAENIYVVTESVFSMDGDCALLKEIADACKKQKAYLIVDEAHAIGIYGEQGRGLCNDLKIEQDCFARIYTFGKALGAHGAAVVGSAELCNYLVNFSRPFIYTTSLPQSSVALIMAAYNLLQKSHQQQNLRQNILLFNDLTHSLTNKIKSTSAIHCFLIPGNENVINASRTLIQNGFDVRAIKNPTVKAGSERLRVCLHATNNHQQIASLAKELGSFK